VQAQTKIEAPVPKKQRLLVPGVLQVIVGLIFIVGGDALRVFGAPGITTVLGYVHMGLGFLALPVGYVMLSAVATARRLASYLNIVMIAYSLATEGIVESIGSLAPAYFLESMVGTLVAVAINLAIMGPTRRVRQGVTEGR
jgi:hypothetical protein